MIELVDSFLVHVASLIAAVSGLIIACTSLWQTVAARRQMRDIRQSVSGRLHTLERRNGDDRRASILAGGAVEAVRWMTAANEDKGP